MDTYSDGLTVFYYVSVIVIFFSCFKTSLSFHCSLTVLSVCVSVCLSHPFLWALSSSICWSLYLYLSKQKHNFCVEIKWSKNNVQLFFSFCSNEHKHTQLNSSFRDLPLQLAGTNFHMNKHLLKSCYQDEQSCP